MTNISLGFGEKKECFGQISMASANKVSSVVLVRKWVDYANSMTVLKRKSAPS